MKNYIHYLLLALCLFTASTLQANEATPLFHVTKKGSGPVMVLIPGLMSDARVWSPIEAELAQHFELHLIELKGFGRTPAINGNEAPEPGWLRAVQQQLLAYVEVEGLTQPVIVGHSLGGFLALALAVEAPAQIGRVVSIDGLPYLAPVYTRDPTTTPEQMAAPAQNMLAFYRGLPNAEALEHTMLQNIGIHAESREHQQWIMKMSAESAPGVAGVAVHDLLMWDLRGALHTIEQPVLILGASGALPEAMRGEAENLYRQQLENLPAQEGPALVMNTQARHFIMLEQPEWLVQRILEHTQ
ncbi:alpha/beta fold hydrolase [Aliidiomarina celeris]|uniref:alpha/beta fold hydrolase n=1 Tax=Aliidiomarina celeris TaxID=2249428 RepID=UPI000DEBD7F2|nr:alpha/beta hydrolase [Aliidiomarina celeris]